MLAIILNLVLYFAYFIFVGILNTFRILDVTFEAATLFFIAVFEIPIFASVILRRLKKPSEPEEQPTPPPAAEETVERTDE